MNTGGTLSGPRRHGIGTTAYGAGSRVMDGLLWAVGACAALLGLFILLGPHDQYVGLGGDLSWRVGDIHLAWGYGLAAAGVLALLGAVLWTVRLRRAPRIETGALATLLIHAGVFVTVNALLWLQDLALGDGLRYAYWVTIAWGLGLLAHATGYLVQRRRS